MPREYVRSSTVGVEDWPEAHRVRYSFIALEIEAAGEFADIADDDNDDDPNFVVAEQRVRPATRRAREHAYGSFLWTMRQAQRSDLVCSKNVVFWIEQLDRVSKLKVRSISGYVSHLCSLMNQD